VLRIAHLVALALCVSTCRGGDDAARAHAARLTLIVPVGVDASALILAPEDAITSRQVHAQELRIALHPGALGELSVQHAQLCPQRIELAGLDGTARRVALRELFELGDDRAQVGFGGALRVEVQPGCREATAGRVVWEQLAGAPLVAVREARNGFLFTAQMPSAVALLGAAPPWGIVPITPRTRGEVTLRATLRRTGKQDVARTLRAAAIARASGMPSVGLGTQLLLGGSGWRVTARPNGSHAEPQPLDVSSGEPVPAALLELDAKGRFELADADGRTLVVRAGSHGETPLDCGRRECHASAATHAAESPMTSILARGLDGALGADYDPRCALACHAVGEPGIGDGGFAHVASELDFALPARGAPDGWAALPRPLRRLGGVGCTACHGPGAIPEEGARNAILAGAVCATCHDAPPRYGHVAALATTAMARSDVDPATRSDPLCARCHTTSAFVGRGVPHADAPPIGVACAACHAPHGESGAHLLRVVLPPASLGARGRALAQSGSAICTACHAPIDGAGAPYASSALLLFAESSPRAANPHDSERGCLACHGSSGGRGASHDFAATRERCAACHDDADARFATARVASRELTTRAERLATALGVRVTRGHVSFTSALDARDEARRAVALVLEDRAAGVHGAANARALLDRAERAIVER